MNERVNYRKQRDPNLIWRCCRLCFWTHSWPFGTASAREIHRVSVAHIRDDHKMTVEQFETQVLYSLN